MAQKQLQKHSKHFILFSRFVFRPKLCGVSYDSIAKSEIKMVR